MKKILLFFLTAVLTTVLATPAMAFHFEPKPGISAGIYATNNFSTEYKFSKDGTGEKTNELEWNISNTLGAFAKANNFSGKWELGFKGPSGGASTVYSRLLYGTYAFNDKFKLTMGQTYFPNFWWSMGSETKEGNTGTGYGVSQDARTPMIRIDYGPAYFLAAYVHESTMGIADAATTRTWPKMMAGFDTTVGKNKVGAGIGYQTHEISSLTANIDTNLVSWQVFAHGQAPITNALTLKSQVFVARNLPQFGVYGHGSLTTTGPAETSADAQLSGGKISDGSTMAGFISAMYKINKDKSVFAGYGFSKSENDAISNGASNKKQELYAGARLTVYEVPAYGVKMYVVPEIHLFDYMDDAAGNDEGSDLYVGGRWKLIF